ncbi:uncharacterized protein LOC105646975 [Jatropha curcas]|uniref:uncharacterized protein LOC105646975 n=1 Tax=Jatropha curcas TaxID=180498 RepID=UPI0018937908|nr:uncharacterized protein LOC105646975 [Jatropha curcas]
MATLNFITPRKISPLSKPIELSHKPNTSPLLLSTGLFRKPKPSKSSLPLTNNRKRWASGSLTEDREVPVKDSRLKDQENPSFFTGSNDFEDLSSSSIKEKGEGDGNGNGDKEKFISRAINASIVLGFGTLAVSKLLTIDHDYWHGWTLYEVLRYVPEHNWIAYEQALKTNPVLAKMAISGIVYSIGDWIAQVMLMKALFPFEDWWVVPAKVAFDQTVWSAIWNSIYFTVLGFLRFESPANIFSELTATFWPMLTAGWKLWPFAHLITYGVIPVEQRLLWVDCVELIWVTILSTYSNEKSESRISEATSESDPNSSTNPSEE